MKVRAARPADRSRIERIARESLRSSYSLSPRRIDSIVAGEFDAAALDGRLADPDVTVFVAEAPAGDGRRVQGFVDVDTGTGRRLRWLHVDPGARGSGIGTALLERIGETDPGSPLTAHVLGAAVEGGEFLAGFGLERVGTEEVSIGGEAVTVAVFAADGSTDDAGEPSVPDSVSIDGRDHPVDRRDGIPGDSAPFFPIATAGDHTEPYGYVCSNCTSTDVAADGLDRLECSECTNAHRADGWDDSYL